MLMVKSNALNCGSNERNFCQHVPEDSEESMTFAKILNSLEQYAYGIGQVRTEEDRCSTG